MYASIRMILFLIFGGVQVKAYFFLMLLNIIMCAGVFIVFLMIYHFIRDLMKPWALVIVVLFSAHIVAYLTMEDFYKFLQAIGLQKSYPTYDLLGSFKQMSSEGFNYVASIISVSYLMWRDSEPKSKR